MNLETSDIITNFVSLQPHLLITESQQKNLFFLIIVDFSNIFSTDYIELQIWVI